MSTKVEAVIFDCFGVVVTDALSALCSEVADRDPGAVTEFKSVVRAANKGIITPEESRQRVAELAGITVDEYRSRIDAAEATDWRLLDYIKRLRANYKTAMLSNITASGLARRFPDDKLSDYFDEIVISSEIGFVKPEPETYLITAQRLGVAVSACIFLDDRETYCEGAREAGMQAILYESFAQATAELEQLLQR
jgi:HAD superfamily hydrolase (TIGR01509 family)